MTILVTGSAGLIGSEVVSFYAKAGHRVIGIDNNQREIFFGADASTIWNRTRLQSLFTSYEHESMDIRDAAAIERLLRVEGDHLELIVHAAAQPSHDWAARDPRSDFDINARATLSLLEAYRNHAPHAPFVFLSTNKVYGDTANRLPLVEQESRWEINPSHDYFERGIDESMTIDNSTHSLFGVSKAAADLLVQEYGRYFDLPTTCLRGGCLTGPHHSGTQLHGFLSYLMKCAMTDTPYTIFGYKGKQVRDNIHSHDLVRAIEAFRSRPTRGQAYNMGGGRFSNCSILEAADACAEIVGRQMKSTYSEANRVGDHIWWISDTTKFRRDYPDWGLKYDVPAILKEIYEANIERWAVTA